MMISPGHGAEIDTLIYAFGLISGACINPAVTTAMIVTRISTSKTMRPTVVRR
ncbi:MAG TPA: aquaporin [Nitrososphaera sp.]